MDPTPGSPSLHAVSTFPCPRCYTPLPYGSLVCGSCGSLVYAARLEQIAREATYYEQADPARAALVWRQALQLLPSDSQQYAQVRERIGLLAGGYGGSWPGPAQPRPVPGQPTNDTPGRALLKTVGSMVISAVVYAVMIPLFTLTTALGFVLLILVHEMGHVFAIRRYGMHASPPIFIPFMGAVINLREQPKNAWQEAVIGIGGPLLGTLGAIACYAGFVYLHDPATANLSFGAGFPPSEIWARHLLLLAALGFMLNLFNMIPVPPLDGGRIMAGVSVWAWMLGLVLFVSYFVHIYYKTGRVSVIGLLVLFMALPRILAILRSRERNAPYYQIGGTRRIVMGITYVALTALLTIGYILAADNLQQLEHFRLF
jgi:Zn-dependent protease